MSRIVYYAAVSLDGFIADTHGGVGWLDPFQSEELGYDAFFARVSAVVLGRTTYEQALTFGPWPYHGRNGLLLTERPVSGLPAGVESVGVGDLAARLKDLQTHAKGDIWIVGGGRTARACLDRGFLDELELYVIPSLLGAGVPLFEQREALIPLRLVESHAFSNGVTRLRYAIRTMPGRATALDDCR